MVDKSLFNKGLDKQLDKTCAVKQSYTSELEILKDIFYDSFDQPTVLSFLELVKKVGHPTDRTLAVKFENDYNSGNFDEAEVKWFKKAYTRYKDQYSNLNDKEESV